MPPESNADALTLARVVRWAAVFLLVLVGVVLYFRAGLHLPPFGAPSQ
jgi:hypothetical protein